MGRWKYAKFLRNKKAIYIAAHGYYHCCYPSLPLWELLVAGLSS